MALKFNLVSVNDQELEDIKSERGGRYDGPTPPAGVYKVVLKKLWLSEQKRRDTPEPVDVIKALLEIKETGDKEVYNGKGIFHTMQLPVDRGDQYFPLQVNALDDFFRQISKGKFNYSKLAAALGAGKLKVEKEDNAGVPVSQIGTLVIKEGQELTIKTKNSANPKDADNPYVNVHYIISDPAPAKKKQEEEEFDDDFEDSEDDDDASFDEFMED